ncbi:MAG: hypothetical protein AVO33_01655 [delta proteobacterium ML8_F1]|nr:MAG: hypothetical protein AVO33_01655 [delta proteobacterium ML8_F1]
MDKCEILVDASLDILSNIEEGIHIVDAGGVTIFYNRAMEVIEGLREEMVTGKHLEDLYPEWTQMNSTMLTVLKTGREIINQEQTYVNFNGKRISTQNSTYPIFHEGELVGAVEIARDQTVVTDMSQKIMDLQQRLLPESPKNEGKKSYSFESLVGRSPEFLRAIALARRAARTSSSVLIDGDTGTGKELFAQSIHFESKRKHMPFVAQNCAAIPETLLESLLFGTTRGSFTGAMDRKGLFEQAQGGTLFLDEINSMSPHLQAKLLRVLQENYVRRVGGSKDVPIDVRIISAVNEDPQTLIARGVMRKDLYYRINVISLHVPNLKERKGDIPLLVDTFIREFNETLEKDVWMASDLLNQVLLDYEWVGNVRELKNFVESAMNMIEDDEHVMTLNHMPSYLTGPSEKSGTRLKENPLKGFESLPAYLKHREKEIIEAVLSHHRGNVTKASLDLGISRQNLQYKMKIYDFK